MTDGKDTPAFNWNSLVVHLEHCWSAQMVGATVRAYRPGKCYAWQASFEDEHHYETDGGTCKTAAEAMMAAENFCAKHLGCVLFRVPTIGDIAEIMADDEMMAEIMKGARGDVADAIERRFVGGDDDDQ